MYAHPVVCSCRERQHRLRLCHNRNSPELPDGPTLRARTLSRRWAMCRNARWSKSGKAGILTDLLVERARHLIIELDRVLAAQLRNDACALLEYRDP